jgi:hypothetical protein
VAVFIGGMAEFGFEEEDVGEGRREGADISDGGGVNS